MSDFQAISIRLKEVITLTEKKAKILDKDIARSLALDPQYYAVIKRRNKIPYASIALFCKHNKLSINWVLFAQKPQYLT